MNKRVAGQGIHISSFVLFCFFAGIFAGTVWVNLMTVDIKEQLGVFGQARLLKNPEFFDFNLERMMPVLIKRELEAGFLWLTGMTLFAVPGLLATAFFGGFTMSAVISLMTIQTGLFGLPIYILSTFPQILFYVPVIVILFFWGMEPFKKTHAAGFVILMISVAAGAFAESFISPYFMGFFNFSGLK